jgi:cellobiose-specific phosphotransferase system component IIA
MTDQGDKEAAGPDKHRQARMLAEDALRAQRAGDQDKADQLFDQAQRTDPLAVAEVLQEADSIDSARSGAEFKQKPR